MARPTPRVVCLALIRRPGTDAILVSNGEDRVTGDRFQRLLGGGVDFGESGEQALRRELMEELGVALGAARFVGVVENRFVFEARPGHELLLIFETEFADPTLYANEIFEGIEAEPVTAVWRNLDHPEPDVPLYPPDLFDHLAPSGEPSRGGCTD